MRTAAMDDYFFNEIKSHPGNGLVGCAALPLAHQPM